MDMWCDVDTAITVPVNLLSLIDDTDFKTRETGIVYNQAGMDLVWNFQTTAGVTTQTAVTPTTAGVYDWTHSGDGMYKIEIPASGGGSINNDTEGAGWFSGICTGVLPWRGPVIGFRAAGINNLLIDDAHSATRGLAGTALPAAVADAAGGLVISDAGGLDLDAMNTNINDIETDTSAMQPLVAKIPLSDGSITWNSTALASINAECDTAITDASLATASALATVDTNVDSILVDTADMQPRVVAIEVDTNSLNDTKIPNTLNTTASGNIGIDWANVENPTTALDLSGTDIQLVDTTTTNTDMRGTDSAATASALTTHDGKLDTVDTNVDAILVDTAAMQPLVAKIPLSDGVITWNSTALASINAECDTAIGDAALATASALATVDTVVDSILLDTAEIGTAGVGLTNITINAASVDAIWDEDIVAAHTTTDSAGLVLANTKSLATGSGGISTTAESATVTTGSETLTYTSSQELDGTTHDIAHSGGNTEFYYQFDVGITGVATEILWHGHAESNGDSYTVKGYDWVSTSFKQIGTITASNSTTVFEQAFVLTNAMTGTGANDGKVRWQITSADGTNFSTDWILCEYTSLAEEIFLLHSGIAQAGGSNTITLDAGANANDDFYNHTRVVIASGTGDEQERLIVDYDGTTKVATIAPPWTTTPDSTSAFEIEPGLAHAETGWATIKVGLAVAGASTTITLDSNASSTNDFYNDDLVYIDAGTGEGQVRVITDYVGSTKVATVHTAWITTPDTTSEYIVQEAHPYSDTQLSTMDTKLDTIDSNVDSVLVDTTEIGAAGAGLTDLGGMSTAMKAEVNVEALDVIATDTFAELGAVPAATSTLIDKINWLFLLARNKFTQTATTATIRNDADGADIATSTDSDNGTTATRGEWT